MFIPDFVVSISRSARQLTVGVYSGLRGLYNYLYKAADCWCSEWPFIQVPLLSRDACIEMIVEAGSWSLSVLCMRCPKDSLKEVISRRGHSPSQGIAIEVNSQKQPKHAQ